MLLPHSGSDQLLDLHIGSGIVLDDWEDDVQTFDSGVARDHLNGDEAGEALNAATGRVHIIRAGIPRVVALRSSHVLRDDHACYGPATLKCGDDRVCCDCFAVDVNVIGTEFAQRTLLSPSVGLLDLFVP